GIIDQTGNKCLFVSCIDQADKYRLLFDLKDRIITIYPDFERIFDDESVSEDNNPQLEKFDAIPNLNIVLNRNDEIAIVSKPQHMIQSTQLGSDNSILSETYPPNSNQCLNMSEFAENPLHASTICEPISVYHTGNLELSQSATNLDFLQQLNREQLLTLLQQMCKDRKFLKECRKTHRVLFTRDSVSSSTTVKRPKRDRKWYHLY
ncbi:hypothetical protein LOD99_11155, partial [Oopsacas minuta]